MGGNNPQNKLGGRMLTDMLENYPKSVVSESVVNPLHFKSKFSGQINQSVNKSCISFYSLTIMTLLAKHI